MLRRLASAFTLPALALLPSLYQRSQHDGSRNGEHDGIDEFRCAGKNGNRREHAGSRCQRDSILACIDYGELDPAAHRSLRRRSSLRLAIRWPEVRMILGMQDRVRLKHAGLVELTTCNQRVADGRLSETRGVLRFA